MAKKSTNTEEAKQSTVVLNDNVSPIQDDTVNSGSDTLEDTTQDPTNSSSDTQEGTCPNDGDCSNPDHACTCEPGHCPNKDCKSGNYWTKGDNTVQYLYHYDDDKETKLDDANHRKENPIYEAPKDPDEGKADPPASSTPSDDCGPEIAEPWAHDELLKDDPNGHTGLERELHLHCGVTYDVVNMWLDELKTATDKKAVIEKIAWHIPTGGLKSIKVHHKAKIVEALKALK